MIAGVNEHRRADVFRRALPPIIVILTVFAVFALPWLSPTEVRLVVSESQAAGFDNRVALLGLALGGVALAALSYLRPRPTGARTFVRIGKPAGRGVDPRLIILGAVASATTVLVLAVVYRNHPYGDAAYFIDRMTYLAAGLRPYVEVEFPYGPLLLYPEVLAGHVLAVVGVAPYWGYYLFLAFLQVAGALMLAWILRRLNLTDGLRNALFTVIVAFASLQLTLGANLTLVRFLIPFGASLWALDAVTGARSSRWQVAAPALAVIAALAVSPEMAVATLFGLLAGVGRLALGLRRRWAELLLPLLLAATVVGASIAAAPGMFGAFMGGSYQLPLLPGPFAVTYVAAMLILLWGSGEGAASTGALDAAATVTWAATSLVLAAAALGRADVLHVFNSGLGVFLGAVAVLAGARPLLARGAVALIGGVFLTGVLIFGLSAQGPGALAAAVSSGRLSLERAESVAQLIGDPRWEERYRDAATRPDVSALTHRLSEARRVAFLMPLDPVIGAELAERGSLASSYTWPEFANSTGLIEGIVRETRRADTLVVPRADFDRYRAAARGAQGGETPMRLPPQVGGRLRYWQLMLFPVTLTARNPVLDTDAMIGRALSQDWEDPLVVDRYVVLRRRF